MIIKLQRIDGKFFRLNSDHIISYEEMDFEDGDVQIITVGGNKYCVKNTVEELDKLLGITENKKTKEPNVYSFIFKDYLHARAMSSVPELKAYSVDDVFEHLKAIIAHDMSIYRELFASSNIVKMTICDNTNNKRYDYVLNKLSL